MLEQKISLWASLLAASLCVLWGANTVAIKFTLSGLGPFTSATLRFGASALVLWIWAKMSEQPLRPARGQVGSLLLNSLLFTVQLSLVYVGFTLTSASRGALITNLQPFFLLFLAHFFLAGDRITFLKLIGLILGFAGAACIFWDRSALSADFMIGDGLLLVATFTWACSAAYTKHLIRNISSIQLVFYQLLFSIPLFALGAVLWDVPMVRRIDGGLVATVAFQVVLTTSFAFVAWNHLMQAYGAVVLHSFVFLIPVSGVFLAGMLLKEPITGAIILALGLISAGILSVQIGHRRDLATVLPSQVR